MLDWVKEDEKRELFESRGECTYSGVALLADDEGAFDKGSARVVDAVEHRLC